MLLVVLRYLEVTLALLGANIYCNIYYIETALNLEEKMSWCDVKNMKRWTEAEIQDWYDNHPDLILSEYAKQLGLSLTKLKDILLA